MSAQPRLRITEFPKGDDLWRIDWFGEVTFPNRSLLRNHPSVNVYLSKVTSASSLFDRYSGRVEERQKQCTISVGKLMLLRIGDIWKDQMLFDTPGYETETFNNLRVDSDTSVLVKAGLSLEEGGFLLPLSEYPGHQRNTHSYCLRVMLPDERSLVIPCVELIRFYFGSSSELLNLLFRPGLTKDRLYKSRVFNPSTRYMRIALGDQVHPRSATDVGRIAGSASAWKAANLGLSSCLKGISSGSAPYPQGVFPFEGETDLVVSGKWLSRSGKERQTFLVYQIHSCNHPFPFNVLHHTGGTNKAKKRNSSDDEESESHSATSRTRVPKESHLEERDPSNHLKPAVRTINARRQFPDLERKTVYGSKEIHSIRSRNLEKQHDPIREEAAGEPGSKERCRTISLIDAVDQVGIPPVWIAEVYRMLKATPGIEVELLTCSYADGWTVPLPLYASEDGVIDDRLLITEGTSCRCRKVAAFRVMAEDRSNIVIVIESSTSAPIVYSFSRAEQIDLDEVLNRAALQYCELFLDLPWNCMVNPQARRILLNQT